MVQTKKSKSKGGKIVKTKAISKGVKKTVSEVDKENQGVRRSRHPRGAKDKVVAKGLHERMNSQSSQESMCSNVSLKKPSEPMKKASKGGKKGCSRVRKNLSDSESDYYDSEDEKPKKKKLSKSQTDVTLHEVVSPTTGAFKYKAGKKGISKRKEKALSLCMDKQKPQDSNLESISAMLKEIDETELEIVKYKKKRK